MNSLPIEKQVKCSTLDGKHIWKTRSFFRITFKNGTVFTVGKLGFKCQVCGNINNEEI